MNQYYVLYLGDCLEKMKELPNQCIDMILCDLPYGTTKNKWDCTIDLKALWNEYVRIIKDNGCIALFSQTPFDKILGYSNLGMLKYEWVWEKDNSTGFLNAHKMPLKIHENILIFYKKPPKYHPQMREGFKPYSARQGSSSKNYDPLEKGHLTESDGKRYPVDIIKFKRDKDKFHPTQKPVDLLEYLIKTYTDEGDVVLDNCMGSGSTGVACIHTNRFFIGVEKDDEYFEIARERLWKEATRDDKESDGTSNC